MSRRALLTLLAGALLLGAVACTTGAEQPPEARLPEDFPARFPIPDDAEIVSSGDVVMLRVAQAAEEVANYYERALPASGWDVVDRWQGNDPHGQPTFGLVIERAEVSGAISFTPTDAEAVLVRINLRQPAATSAGSG